MSYQRELDECIFCGDSDMTAEHLIAAWVQLVASGRIPVLAALDAAEA